MSIVHDEGQTVGVVRATRAVNGLLLSEKEYPAGLSITPHEHAYALCSIVLHGAMTERRGTRRVSGETGMLNYLPPEEPHAQEYHVDGSRCLIVQLADPWMSRLTALGIALPTRPVDLQRDRANWIADHLYREFQVADTAAGIGMEGFALALLAEIARTGERSERGAKPGWLLRAVDLLHARARESVEMAEIAAEVGVHPTHLARTFRERYGCTMSEYLRRIRIDAARSELTSTDKPLSTIALDAGFVDQGHFSRVFKQITGQTPAAYRRAGTPR